LESLPRRTQQKALQKQKKGEGHYIHIKLDDICPRGYGLVPLGLAMLFLAFGADKAASGASGIKQHPQ